MIFERHGHHTGITIKPTITFNYITPQVKAPMLYSVPYFRPVSVQRPHVLSGSSPQRIEKSSWKVSHRKKIFDRSYTCKSTLHYAFSREASLQSKKTHPQKQVLNNERKAIFPQRKENKRFTFQPSRSHSPAYCINRAPSSEFSHGFQRQTPTQTFHEHFQPILQLQDSTPALKKNINSEIKVDISDSATDRSVNHSQINQMTQERFFDKEVPNNSWQKQEKLSEVSLYATAIQQDFQAARLPSSTFLSNLTEQLSIQIKQNLIPALLILFGFFILLVQLSK